VIAGVSGRQTHMEDARRRDLGQEAEVNEAECMMAKRNTGHLQRSGQTSQILVS
jgi:hypothetical protein